MPTRAFQRVTFEQMAGSNVPHRDGPIEIIPPFVPVHADITIPGSKSLTNRAMVLAALSDGEVVLRGALWSEDTEAMFHCLQQLGISVSAEPDPEEPANRHNSGLWHGRAARPGRVRRGSTGIVCRKRRNSRAIPGRVRLSGTRQALSAEWSAPHARSAPSVRPLHRTLRDTGYRVDSPNGRLPALIHGAGPKTGAKCSVPIGDSSQFASALLLARARGNWEVTVEGDDPEESPYVKMTLDLIEQFPQRGTFPIEPDASSASYFWGAGWLLGGKSRIRVANWMTKIALQIDARFPDFLRVFPPQTSRHSDLGDSIMTAIVLAPFAEAPKVFTDLERLRVQECERVEALRTELQKCGARITEDGESLRVEPGPLHGATIETYNDHRMAMCFAMLGLRVPGMRIINPLRA